MQLEFRSEVFVEHYLLIIVVSEYDLYWWVFSGFFNDMAYSQSGCLLSFSRFHCFGVDLKHFKNWQGRLFPDLACNTGTNLNGEHMEVVEIPGKGSKMGTRTIPTWQITEVDEVDAPKWEVFADICRFWVPLWRKASQLLHPLRHLQQRASTSWWTFPCCPRRGFSGCTEWFQL